MKQQYRKYARTPAL